MEELEKMFLEAKDTSELMIDLAYSSLLYNNKEIAEEVFVMEEMVDELTSRLQEEAIKRAIDDKNVHKALAVIRLATSIEEISDAAMQIADIVLRELQLHPVVHLSLKESDVIITTAKVSEKSELVNKTLEEIKLPSRSGMWLVAIKRGKKYIYGPDKHAVIQPDDILIARGPPEGEEYEQAGRKKRGEVKWRG